MTLIVRIPRGSVCFAPLAGFALVALVGCGSDPAKVPAQTPTPTPKSAVSAPDPAPKAAPSPDPKIKVVDQEAPQDASRFAVSVDSVAVKTGERGKVAVRIVPKEPWHMNLDYPTSLRVDAPAGVAVAKPELKKADATKLDEKGCEFFVDFTANEVGEKAFTGKLKFAVCQDEACVPVTEDVAFKVAVNP